MKILNISLVALMFFSCAKDCAAPQGACADVPPTNELCQAAFNRWFYMAASNKCEQIGYSGCSAKGFATKAECEACLCN